MTKGLIFNVQRYSTDDGPGIRTTVFLKGCPLSCTWCHNPEGVSARPEVLVVADRCTGCGECGRVCPVTGHEGDRHDAEAPSRTVDSSPGGADLTAAGTHECLACGRCVEVCVAGARRLVGAERTPEEILLEVERDRAFYESTNGGVTFSGGEPLAQGEFLMKCLRYCRESGLHTVVDTSGWSERSLMLAVAESADMILFDLKTLDPERHLTSTGVPLEPIIENLRAVDASGAALVIRLPLVPGVNDDDENLRATADAVKSLSRTVPVQLLPFHRTATDKYRRLGRRWKHEGLSPVSSERMEAVAAFLRELGVQVLTGRG